MTFSYFSRYFLDLWKITLWQKYFAKTFVTKVIGGLCMLLCMLLVQIPMLSRFTTLSQARHARHFQVQWMFGGCLDWCLQKWMQVELSAPFVVVYGIALGCTPCTPKQYHKQRRRVQRAWRFWMTLLVGKTCWREKWVPKNGSRTLELDTVRYCAFADPEQVKKTRNI